LLQHDIDTGDAKSIRQPPRRPPLASGKADDVVDEMLAAAVNQPSDSLLSGTHRPTPKNDTSQGSIISPILFLVMINDLPANITKTDLRFSPTIAAFLPQEEI